MFLSRSNACIQAAQEQCWLTGDNTKKTILMAAAVYRDRISVLALFDLVIDFLSIQSQELLPVATLDAALFWVPGEYS